jgi:putative PIN family toxin of toxin-antitoxin system
MVFLQATTRPTGPSARLFVEFVENGRLGLYVSNAILNEIREVLGRPRFRAKNPTVTHQSVDEFCRRIEQIAQKVDPVPASFALARDPDDEPYLNLAIAVPVDYLVTWDNDMLDRMQDSAFRSQYPTLAILDPVALLRLFDPPSS